VKVITGALATIAADEVEKEYGLWRADPDDVEGIAAPAARLVYRRLPDEAKGTDALDIFQLGLAVAGYLAKQLHRRAALRQLRATGQLQDQPADSGPAPATA
jgi:hypothetical protein